MRNLFHYTLIAVMLISLSACGPEKSKNIKEMKGLTAVDSLVYYYAQMRAYDYNRMALNDTSFNNRQARRQYMEGFHKGLALIKNDNPAYNKGLQEGISLALRNLEFEKQNDVKIKPEIMEQSMAYGILVNDTIDPIHVQANFYNNLHSIRHRDLEQDLSHARKELEKEAKVRDMVRINDDLYCRIVEPGEGLKVEPGDRLDLHMSFARCNGEDLGLPSPRVVTVGEKGMPETVTQMYCNMNNGETAVFETPAYQVFGDKCDAYGLQSDEIVILTIKINNINRETPPQTE